MDKNHILTGNHSRNPLFQPYTQCAYQIKQRFLVTKITLIKGLRNFQQPYCGLCEVQKHQEMYWKYQIIQSMTCLYSPHISKPLVCHPQYYLNTDGSHAVKLPWCRYASLAE